MDMFNRDDVATLLTKRKQKFAGSFARMNSILCELVVVISDSLVLLLLLFFSLTLLLLSLLSYYLVCFIAVFTTNKDVYLLFHWSSPADRVIRPSLLILIFV